MGELLGEHGHTIDPESQTAAAAKSIQARVDDTVRSWRNSELDGFDEAAVKELGRLSR